MNVVKCVNGHFFDADKYQLCPHCGAVSITGVPQTADSPQKKDRQPFWKKSKEQDNVDVIVIPEKPENKTFGVFGDKPDDSLQIEENQMEEKKVEEKKPEEEEPKKVENETKEEKESLRNVVKSVVAGNDGKTVGYFSSGQDVSESEPVVGWLVCVKGKHFGECFNVVAGRNSIGREDTNKIVFSKDGAVSRSKHAWITYEPKKREFFVQPGESSGLSYLNDENIMEAKKINAHDRLEFGNSMFLFIPLCGEDFTWEDYINEEK